MKAKNWFERNLDSTGFLVVMSGIVVGILLLWALSLLPLEPGSVGENIMIWVGICLELGIVVGVLVGLGWILRKKNRSSWNLLWLSLGPVGYIIFMSLKNRSAFMDIKEWANHHKTRDEND